MNILIVYASNSGGTYLTAKQIAEFLESQGDNVTLLKAADTSIGDFDGKTLVLMGTNTWDILFKEGQPHEAMSALLQRLDGQDFTGKLFAFFGCGDKSYLHFCQAVDTVKAFIESRYGVNVLEPLKIDGYFFSQDKNKELIETWSDELVKKLPVSSII
jgi:flavodoxin I